jgi:glycosyltransferase 2 family protein
MRWRWLAALLVLGTLVVVASMHAEERRFAELLGRAQPAWILAIVLLQLATYGCLVHVWAKVIRRVNGAAPSRLVLVELALAELFTDQALPSGGVGGTIFVVSALDRRGIPKPAAGAAVTVSLFGFYAAQLLAVGAALVVLLVEHRAGAVTSGVGLVALAAAVATPIVTITIAAGGIDRIPKRLRRFKVVETLRSAIESAPRGVIFDPWLLARAAASRLLILLLDGVTLAAALAAIGHPLALADGCIVFVLASTVASISMLPGGLGSYEALSIALLIALGVPLEAAAPATLVMRGFSFWLPMLPGLWFARKELAAPAGAPQAA